MQQERCSESGTASATTKFIIKGAYFGEKCFPGLNDLLHEAEKHPNAYNQMKRQYQTIAINAIRRDLRGYKAKGLIALHYTFGEPNKGNRRDYANIVSAGRKIINDALTKTKTIKQRGLAAFVI